MAISQEKKKEIVKELEEKLEKAKAVVFFDISAATHKELEKARKEIKKLGGEIKIAKKTLFNIAAGSAKLPGIEVKEQAPVAFAFGYEEEVTTPQLIYKLAKGTSKFAILGGIIEGEIKDKETMLAVAKLPSKEELIAKVIHVIKSPLSSIILNVKEIPGQIIKNIIVIARR